MVRCSVKGCESESFPNCGISFHCLPNDPVRRQLWLSTLPLRTTTAANTHVCSQHFRREDYLPWKRSTLRSHAVPSHPQVGPPPTPKVPIWPHLVISSSDTNRPIIQTVKSESDTKKKNTKNCMQVCRVCLATGRKMADLRDSLRQAYEDVSGVTLTAADSLPQLCWECGARALAAARFRERARRAHRLLAALRPQSRQITPLDIASINRKQNGLESQLSRSNFVPDDYHVHVNEQTIKMKVDETPTNLLTEVENSNEQDHNYSKCVLSEMNIDEKEDRNVENDEFDWEVTNENETIDDINDNHKADDDDDQFKIEPTEETIIDNNAKIAKKKQSTKKPKSTSNIDRFKAQEILEKYFAVATLSHEEQVAEILDRKESINYKNSAYKCELCYRGFSGKNTYNSHHLKHTEKFGAYECPICKRRQKSEPYMRRHVLSFHATKYSCKKCDFTTHCKFVAQSHIKYHDGVHYQCSHCSKQFVWRSTYYNHMRTKHACAFACALCGHTFISELGLRHHKRTFHLSDESETLAGPYCETCDVKFVSDDAHAKHLTLSSRHRSDGDVYIQNDYRPAPAKQQGEKKKRDFNRPGTPITCEQCNTTLPSRTAYASHFRKEHRGVARTQHPVRFPCIYMCEQCGRKFQTMSMLKNHKPVHTGVRGFKCSVCGKAFVTQMTLYAHMRLHRDERPTFACPECGKAFSTQSNRSRHMFTHTGLKPCECSACGKRFATAAEARSHVDHVHNKKPWPRRLRRRRAPTEH